MTARLLEGKVFAAKLKEEAGKKAQELKAKYGITPGLAVIIVGENPASQVYVRNKHKACTELGFYSEGVELPATTTREELLAEIQRLNNDEKIHGILVQLPLPKELQPYESEVLEAINPLKDVDGFHPVNVGRLVTGQKALVPCTPHGCLRMLELAEIPVEGANAVIIGRSNIVGKPMFHLLLGKNATVTICHSRTKNLAEITRQADILVAAVGKAGFVTADMVKPGAAVIDVGINRIAPKKLVGDVDFEAVKEVAGAITPVPGGVGLLTIAMLMQNTVEAARLQLEG
ncbi:MAG: bifunctional methylenetetrahydrofolate dehydrogenase/methenyltetrahydrofolate cyclohydrolase FolD [Veillonellaceae bacterium]|uniref:bifunctional methylenetetrahydrofolate dehydrogenase/methenyltetrahydrofolate cyclohydrolase FolD n=1 Tax=Anaerovibrio lipolyticus TaxID=82374 RepID=UPI001F3EC275|nr:bifunctional methylenetetrahydrofolate dehydrogenase/methenyltetrahydrofolate cyclohydrolase FolD [Anaerovibrio lipolyticus]MCI6911074.1 bifunctional methylenetetrahydrofolate dehydrogenase/methenyltetrahydrofolate cyclohydrolase FolD [Veillonellaceae bacterium]MDY4485099.1 bifunctional methylenetetrahydrofolate dehydrogenase/methenyltetrahydrofolate cyclohydrolase FolD [Anaerovibrio sp.]MCF2600529.1 bifunctional methylenetetrahydrofolate dehydrogenase/methenyltetrahydrofolate cyclohydrolase 